MRERSESARTLDDMMGAGYSGPERRAPQTRESDGSVHRTGHPGLRRAGLGGLLLFLGVPPVLGSVLASLVLTSPSRVPWVMGISAVLAVLFLRVAAPLARRSESFSVAGYRRAAELSVMLGLTGIAVVAYTIGIYLVLGIRTPWALGLFSGG